MSELLACDQCLVLGCILVGRADWLRESTDEVQPSIATLLQDCPDGSESWRVPATFVAAGLDCGVGEEEILGAVRLAHFARLSI
jgi:hypothetical protein